MFDRVIDVLESPFRIHLRIISPSGIPVRLSSPIFPDVYLHIRSLVRLSVPGDAIGLSGRDRERIRDDLNAIACFRITGGIIHLQRKRTAMGLLLRNGHVITTVVIRKKTGRGQLPGSPGGKVLEVDDDRLLLGTAAGRLTFAVDNADIVDDNVLGGGDPAGILPYGRDRQGDGKLAPLVRNLRLGLLTVAGNEAHGSFSGKSLGPERENIRLLGFQFHIDLQGGPVGDRLRGIVTGEDVIRILAAPDHFEPLGNKPVQGTGLEIPVLLDKGSIVIRGGIGNHIVQVVPFLLAVPAERVAEELIPAAFGPTDHLVRLGEIITAVSSHDGVMLHLVAKGDGGKITPQDCVDIVVSVDGVIPILPIRERNAQLETRLRGEFLQLIFIIVHHLRRRRRIRSDRFVGTLDRFGSLLAGQGGGQDKGREDMGG